MKWIFEVIDLALRVTGMLALFSLAIPPAEVQTQVVAAPVAVTVEL